MEAINDSLKNVSQVLEFLREIDTRDERLPVNFRIMILENIVILEKTVDTLSKNA